MLCSTIRLPQTHTGPVLPLKVSMVLRNPQVSNAWGILPAPDWSSVVFVTRQCNSADGTVRLLQGRALQAATGGAAVPTYALRDCPGWHSVLYWMGRKGRGETNSRGARNVRICTAPRRDRARRSLRNRRKNADPHRTDRLMGQGQGDDWPRSSRRLGNWLRMDQAPGHGGDHSPGRPSHSHHRHHGRRRAGSAGCGADRSALLYHHPLLDAEAESWVHRLSPSASKLVKGADHVSE